MSTQRPRARVARSRTPFSRASGMVAPSASESATARSALPFREIFLSRDGGATRRGVDGSAIAHGTSAACGVVTGPMLSAYFDTGQRVGVASVAKSFA